LAIEIAVDFNFYRLFFVLMTPLQLFFTMVRRCALDMSLTGH